MVVPYVEMGKSREGAALVGLGWGKFKFLFCLAYVIFTVYGRHPVAV